RRTSNSLKSLGIHNCVGSAEPTVGRIGGCKNISLCSTSAAIGTGYREIGLIYFLDRATVIGANNDSVHTFPNTALRSLVLGILVSCFTTNHKPISDQRNRRIERV